MFESLCGIRIDWSATGSFLAGIGGLVAGAATLLLAWYAKEGLHAWRAQQLGVREIDLAQELLAKVYTMEEILKFVVSPFVSTAELEGVPRKDGETVADYEIRRTYDAVIMRYEKHAEQISEVRTMAFRARAILGEEIFEATRKILEIRSDIQRAAHLAYLKSVQVARLERQAQIGIQVAGFDEAFAEMREAQDAFWGLREDDNLSRKITRKTDMCAALLRRRIEEFSK